jgi:hypothetical protein
MKKILAIGFLAALMGCGGGGGSSSPCASESEISLALLNSTMQWQGISYSASLISGQVVVFDGASFQVSPGQTIQIQTNIPVPQACRSGMRFAWGRTGNGSTRSGPLWLDVDSVTGMIHGVVPVDVGNSSTGGSLVEVDLPGAQLRFLNFGITVTR